MTSATRIADGPSGTISGWCGFLSPTPYPESPPTTPRAHFDPVLDDAVGSVGEHRLGVLAQTYSFPPTLPAEAVARLQAAGLTETDDYRELSAFSPGRPPGFRCWPR